MENLYKKQFPKRSFTDTVFDVLRMGPGTTKWKQFQGVAQKFQGGSLRPNRKLLPSSLRTVAEMDSPSTLAALMHQEKFAHDTHDHEFHMGGGLYETAGSIFSALWGMTGKAAYNHWYGHNERHQEGGISDLDSQYAKAVSEAYKKKGTRSDVGDWELQEEYSDDRFAVFKDEDKVHVALRGTKPEALDLWKDAKIIYRNSPGDDEDIRDRLTEIADAFPDSDLDVSGHSLGSNQLVNAFEGYSDVPEMQRYGRINLFNPGTSPLSHLDTHKEAVDDDRVHLYLNTGDLLSNTYTYLVNSDRDNVTYADPGFSPLGNHGLAQWSGDEEPETPESY